MRALTTRERWLVAVLPAVLLAAGYVVLWRDPYHAEAIAGRERRLAGRGDADAETLRRSITERQPEVDALADREAALEARAVRLQDRWTRPIERAATVRRVAQVLQERGVRLVESASQESSKDRPAIAPGLVELARGLRADGGAEPELWRFALQGRYGDLLDALARLESLDDLFALPVTLALERSGHSDTLDVTLWIWI